ncbi:hypothetical protein HZA38_06490 [Candidatus Peregrinibacteria bacterium]|nr:hypothetical protein [Candidatus Peregrinibacteria bacterium]
MLTEAKSPSVGIPSGLDTALGELQRSLKGRKNLSLPLLLKPGSDRNTLAQTIATLRSRLGICTNATVSTEIVEKIQRDIEVILNHLNVKEFSVNEISNGMRELIACLLKLVTMLEDFQGNITNAISPKTLRLQET